MRRKKRRATIIATGLHRRSRAKSPILKNHPKLILLTAVLICGLVLGAMTVRNPNEQLADALRTVIENEIQTGAGQPIWKKFLSTLGTETLYMLIALVSGLCVAGEPLLWALPLVKGMGVGLIAAYLYKTYTINGMLYFSAVYLLPSVIAAASFLFCCNESILMTRDLNRILLKNENAGADGEMLRLYFLRYTVLFASFVFSAALGAVLAAFFSERITLLL